MMACHKMPGLNLFINRHLLMAQLRGIGTAGCKPTSRLGVHRASQLSLHDDPFALGLWLGIGMADSSPFV